MEDFLRFAILGLGAGAVYGLAALGIVLVYRGSGVVNFAQGAIGMVGAFVFYNARESGTATFVALAEALAVGAAIGMVIHLLVMRPLRHAPAISRPIATLGVFTILLGFGQSRWGDVSSIVAKVLPTDAVTLWGDVTIGADRLVLFGIGIALTALLAVLYRVTSFGLATSAVAENRRATAAQGISPDLVATANWGLGGALGVLAAVLIVNLTGLDVLGLALLLVPALAAALVGGFRSFPLTFAGGLLIGILESEVAYAQIRWDVTLSGWARSVPFLVIVIVLVARGRALPLRGEGVERPPEVGTGMVRPAVLVPTAAVVCALAAFGLSTTLVDALTTTFALGVILLSLVVVTGYTGQLSLAQVSLAGMGAWIAARSVVNYDLGFEVAFVLAVVATIPIGVLVGLPALRTRGVNLAVATLGLALFIESMVLTNLDRTGGATGTNVGSARFFGVDFDTFRHPERYAILTVLLFCGCGLLVANLRRGRAGRRLVAVRSNERAAAALGISVYRAKLYAFGLGAGLAAIGGVLVGFRRPTVTFFPTFSVFESIFAVVFGVIGGVGFIVGAALGAGVAPGNIVVKAVGGALDDERTVQIVLGVALIAVLVLIPNGLASIRLARPRAWLASRLPAVGDWVAPRRRTPPPLPEAAPPRLDPATLVADGVSVTFGGVVALDDVTLEVGPGEVVGLIGPNGAGKTTLIDAMTGFVPCDTGSVTLDGRAVGRWSARRRALAGIGRSFQTLELFETMTVRDNLRCASEDRSASAYLTDLVAPGRPDLGAAAVAAIAEFELADDLERRPDELPYGRRRLVAIARAVAGGPSVLLLDEPAAGLDTAASAELGRLVRRLADDWGIGVLLVEHDVGLVLEVCDRVVVLDFGNKIAEGTPAEIRDDPAVVDAYLGDAAPAQQPRSAAEPGAVAPAGGGAGGEVVLEALGLSAGYGELAAVRDLDLEVRAGEVVALLGPNGSGKTTTVLTLAGELKPLDGAVEWLGQPTRSALHRRVREGMAFVPEERSVIMGLTVAANLRLGRGSRATALDRFPELEPLLGRRAGLCSGGEQQILSMARALAAEPRVLLADELSLGLAPAVVDRLLREVRAAADRGAGVVLVEQHVHRALSVADRVYVLRNGRLELEGDAADVAVDLGSLERAYLATGEAPPAERR